MKKIGPNVSDVNKIRALHEDGLSVAEIADQLQIEDRAVAVCLNAMEGVKVDVPGEPAEGQPTENTKTENGSKVHTSTKEPAKEPEKGDEKEPAK